ncbi:MAG: HD domain-containing protein [Lachnospiraceae bacterium]|nr:HD domain-containing protein [Lachnospiraceae bacterium]
MYYSFLVIYYAAFTIMTICMFVINIQQSSYSQKLMSSLCSWCSFIAFGYCIKITYPTSLEYHIIGQKILLMAFLHALFYLLLFVYDFCNEVIPYRIQLFLIINNFVMSFFALILDRHDLLYTGIEPVNMGGIYYFKHYYGPMHTIYYAEMFVYMAVMVYMIMRHMVKTGNSTRRASLLLLTAIFLNFAACVAQKVIVTPYEFIPAGFILSMIIMLHLIYVEKVYNVNDVAKDYIFDSIDSAYIVCDGTYRYKGSNIMARKIFHELEDLNVDDSLYSASQSLRQIINGDIRQMGFEGGLYEPSIKRIYDGKSVIAIVISLTNVTSQFEYKALQDSYREELQVEVEKQTRYAEERHKKVEQMSFQLVQTLANAIDAKDKYTNGHSSRVAEYSVRVARAMGWDKEAIDILRYEGLLHDIGKIGISDVILNKASQLSDDEFDILKDHVTIGGDIMHDASTLPGADNVILHHHERYDGTGYPDGLRGEQIPEDARIVAIADTYDAMSSNRVYRKALPKEVIRVELLKGSGRQFDPKILDVFISLFDRGLLDDVAPKDNGWFD